MEQDVLSPGVQHGGETDFRSQVSGSGGDLLQGPGDGSEQDIKKDGRVAESERIQFDLRYRLQLEGAQLAPATINVRLAAIRRLAYEAADSGLLSPELVAGKA